MITPRLDVVRTVMRETALDAMPELAVQLQDDPTVVQRHLIGELSLQPDGATLALLNTWPSGAPDVAARTHLRNSAPTETTLCAAQFILKCERYTLVQSATQRQATMLLGERPEQPADARYDSRWVIPSSHSPSGYSMSHKKLFAGTAQQVAQDNSWLSTVHERYHTLFNPFYGLRERMEGMPTTPSRSIHTAMNGAGLALHLMDTAEWLRNHRDTKHLGPEQRAGIAHDLAYLGLTFASQHFEDVLKESIISLKGTIRQLPETVASPRKWIYIAGSATQDPTYHKVTKRSTRQAPTFKCPVHQPTREEPTSELEYYLHASVTHAASHDLFA